MAIGGIRILGCDHDTCALLVTKTVEAHANAEANLSEEQRKQLVAQFKDLIGGKSTSKDGAQVARDNGFSTAMKVKFEQLRY